MSNLSGKAAELANRRKAVKGKLSKAKLARESARGDLHERYERPVEDLERQIAELDEEIGEAQTERRTLPATQQKTQSREAEKP